MTKLINAIELNRIDRRRHTMAIEAQTTALKAQTTEMRREHGELIFLMSRTMNELNWNIMWLDGMVFLPLITLGIENIVNKQKWKFYTIFLAIMLISNYFIGYMICLFSVVYFIFYNTLKTKYDKNKISNTFKLKPT